MKFSNLLAFAALAIASPIANESDIIEARTVSPIIGTVVTTVNGLKSSTSGNIANISMSST